MNLHPKQMEVKLFAVEVKNGLQVRYLIAPGEVVTSVSHPARILSESTVDG
jgi:hypothetical protein